MSDPNERASADGRDEPPGGPEANGAPGQNRHDATPEEDFIAELKREIENSRLPADVREQILAELPPPEEQERLYRELIENGGLSFEELMESLGLEAEPKP